MNKNLLSIAIILLAVAIIAVNVWNPQNKETNEESTDLAASESVTATEDVPGVDLSEVQEGKPAPDFELTTLAGETVKLSDYQGKKVILNFWATWCPPCKAEMPHMQNFYEENKDKGVEIVAVNLTDLDNGRSEIESFVKEYGLSFDIPLDEKGTIGTQYQAFTIPTSYVIDSNGIITQKIIGPMDENMMADLTESIQ
ncbi:redoxin domain-containing protein [Bacillus thermotolerans]|uniref:Thiol:disulfide oxidoreductase ResA-like protein n=1 Tax=Bacillus thermotolerans TaxID=1221996 RepID=A0A0F5HJR5_BACTR|nr:redoxin domain-containing protein [Bacillus thermotolerans]KKB33536.1 thiol:disulfide oxidoreductase ResA-like protein [Bacillus thermotolerans]KKB34033.1 thiol:disulfide oxidoreductase ResA-like protein [Bacillus thermotolerans]KKB35797.1 Thiol:disulfide oxidoreductase ResA-like protein [Bacillus thermotolerans]